MSVPCDVEPGNTVAGYRIDRLLGRGGMGVVFLAEDLALKRRVALKLLPANLADESSFTERFLRESELAASLDHPNVIPVYAAGEADGRLFLAMRYVPGPSLRDLTRMGPLEPSEAFAIAAQVAGALDAAHAHGLVHRDVKPSNVLIAPAAGADGSDHVYLADFGLSRKLGERERRGAEERLMGTVEYAAPEQIRGGELDGRVDVYALSCLLYECLTGVPPFQRRSAAATLFAHMEEEPPLASRRNPGLPLAVDAVLTRGLAKSPAERYPSCRQLVDDARQALGVSARRRRRALRPPRAIVLTAVTGALALTGLTVALTHGDEPTGDAGRALRAAQVLAPPGDSVVRIDPETNKVVAAIAAPPDQTALDVGATSVWVGTAHDYGLIRIDPAANSQLPAPELRFDVDSVASTGTTIAAVTSGPPVGTTGPLAILTLLSSQCGFYGGGPCTIALPQRRPRKLEPFSAAPSLGSDADQIWITDPTRSTVSRVDPKPLQLVDTVSIPTQVGKHRLTLSGIAVGEGGVWVKGGAVRVIPHGRDSHGRPVYEDRPVVGYVWRVDPVTKRVVARIRFPRPPDTIAAGGGSIWVTGGGDPTVWRIDPATNRVSGRTNLASSGYGDLAASGIAFGYGSLWVGDPIGGVVRRLDPRTLKMLEAIPVGPDPQQIAVGFGSVWVTHWDVQPYPQLVPATR